MRACPALDRPSSVTQDPLDAEEDATGEPALADGLLRAERPRAGREPEQTVVKTAKKLVISAGKKRAATPCPSPAHQRRY
jgi:hypothetical protein